MTDLTVGVGPVRARRWPVVVVAVAWGCLATYLLAIGSAVGAAGTVTVGLAAAWLVLDFPAAAVALLAASIVIPNGVALYLGPAVPLVTFQRVALPLLTLGAILFSPAGTWRALWNAPGVRLLWLMTAIVAVSVVLTREQALARREFFTERNLGLPLFFAAVWLALADRRSVHRLLVAVGVVGLVVTVLAVAEAVSGHGVVAGLHLLPSDKLKELGYLDRLELRAGFPRVESVFQHPLILGAFLVMYVPLVVALRRHAGTTRARWCWTVALTLAVLALVLTWSRGAWIALLIAVLLLRGAAMRRWVLVAAGAAVFAVVWAQAGLLQPGTAYRWWLLNSVFAVMWGHYGFGTGPGTFVKSVVIHITGTGLHADPDAMAYSLTAAIEAGPIFVAVFWTFALRAIRRARAASDHAAAAGRLEDAHLLDALRAGVLANLLLSVISASLFGGTAGLFIIYMLIAAAARLGDSSTGG